MWPCSSSLCVGGLRRGELGCESGGLRHVGVMERHGLHIAAQAFFPKPY